MSTSRTPTSATFRGSTFGAYPPMCVSSRGPMPMQHDSGMPWTLPLGLVSGVFISACASIQMSPSACFRFRKCRDIPDTVPTATE
jgi:hypothetical protein